MAEWLKRGVPMETRTQAGRAVRDVVERTLADIAQRGDAAVREPSVKTPMTAAMLQDDAFHNVVLMKFKLGRLGRLEDVMGAIVYLASDASALVTGTSIVIDGGWTAD